jgi:saccharopine dehydrogenase-like NADP-dependent oxidoreductase
MIKRVLIIGGYGNFGSFITRALAQENNIQLIIAGRTINKADKLAQEINTINKIETIDIDINNDLSNKLNIIKPDIVIHTSGPFQTQSYNVAKACIEQGCHYIDLADGRDFVAGIRELDDLAKAKDVLIISGASSVPCLTVAIVDHYKSEFSSLDKLDYGITTAQKTTRGLATTAAILGYTGKVFKTIIDGKESNIFGWQGLHARKYKHLGWRLLGNCDVPDLVLFPERYPELKTIRFYAGLEIPFIHLTLWILSWLVRIKLIRHLEKTTPLLLRISFLFDCLGTSNSAFHMELSGKGNDGTQKQINFELTARSGDGPYIPCMPIILITKAIVKGDIMKIGAYPCVDFVTLGEYLDALTKMDITWEVGA